ncbi:hypothetical protein F5878DRAFT_291551 [Lentinula raphanica]|uniref:Uncharacterized protein n=1 Tax=Lentinula raphanica TaxID=153919 RepID=A0AA38P3Y7_9AGAR|nr:hypothetical protein F5878DRAFT_291551 [Lentinula raphanica]
MASNDSLLPNPSWPSLYNPRSELFDIEHHDPIQPGGFYLLNPQDVFRFTLYWTLVFYIPVFVVFGSYAFFNLTFPPSNTHSKALKALEDFDFHSEERQGGHGGGVDNESEEEEDVGEGETYPMSPVSSYLRPDSNLRRNTQNGYYDTIRSEVTATSTTPLSPFLQSPTSATPNQPFLGVSSAHGYPPIPPPPSTHSPTITPRARNGGPTTSQNHKPHKSKNACRSRLTFALLVFFGFLLLSLIGAVVSSAIVGYILTALYKAGDFYMSTWVPFLWAAISVMVGMLNVWPSIIDLI